MNKLEAITDQAEFDRRFAEYAEFVIDKLIERDTPLARQVEQRFEDRLWSAVGRVLADLEETATEAQVEVATHAFLNELHHVRELDIREWVEEMLEPLKDDETKQGRAYDLTFMLEVLIPEAERLGVDVTPITEKKSNARTMVPSMRQALKANENGDISDDELTEQLEKTMTDIATKTNKELREEVSQRQKTTDSETPVMVYRREDDNTTTLIIPNLSPAVAARVISMIRGVFKVEEHLWTLKEGVAGVLRRERQKILRKSFVMTLGSNSHAGVSEEQVDKTAEPDIIGA